MLCMATHLVELNEISPPEEQGFVIVFGLPLVKIQVLKFPQNARKLTQLLPAICFRHVAEASMPRNLVAQPAGPGSTEATGYRLQMLVLAWSGVVMGHGCAAPHVEIFYTRHKNASECMVQPPDPLGGLEAEVMPGGAVDLWRNYVDCGGW